MRRTALNLTIALTLALTTVLTGAMTRSIPTALAKETTRDVCPGLCAYTSIQAAIDDSQDGDIIRVAGTAGAAYSENLVIAKSVQILGGYAGPPGWQRDVQTYVTTVHGQNSGTVATISAGSPLLEGFTLTGGYAPIDGGGLLIRNSSPVISATTVVSNAANSSGGGVAIFGGAPSILSSTIAYNVAMGGAGILIADASAATLRGTTIEQNTGYVTGGGVLIVNGSSPIIDGCVVRGNRSTSGGGIEVLDAAGTISASDVVENIAESGHGGGIFLKGATTTIQATAVHGNVASIDGGGIRVEDSSPLLDNLVVYGNRARSGGGLSVITSLGMIAGSTISSNQAVGSEGEPGIGGGIALDRAAPTLDANSLLANSASDHGGGVSISGRYCATEMCEDPRSPLIVNTVIARNTAGLRGGGVRIASGTAPEIVNSTIVGNAVEGVFIDAYAQAGITNTIVVSNGAGLRALVPSAPSADYNLVWANAQGNYDGLAAGAHDVNADAMFVGPGTDNYRLRFGSPAIDSGLTSAAPGSDRDGNVRPLVGRCDGQQIADIGAYEFLLSPGDCAQATATATATATPSPTGPPAATGTATASSTPSRTATRTLTATATATPSATATAAASATRTLTATPTRTGTAAPSATPTNTTTPTTVVHRVAIPIIVSGFLPDCAAYEPNDSLASAWGPLQMNVTYRARLCQYDAVDWYYFETRRAGALSVDLAVPDLAADLSLYVHAADGSIIAESTNPGEGADESIVVVLQSGGRFYIRVEPVTRRDANQPYELIASFY